MNALKKIYCRIFQNCFKMALPILPYRKPRIFYSTSKLSMVFEENKINNVLIVTDKSIHDLGLLDRMLEHLDHHNIKYLIYDGTVANPTTTNVEEAREIYLKNKVLD